MPSVRDTIRDPKDMALNLKGFWEPLWNKDHPSKLSVDEYLAGYDKRVDSPIPPISLEIVSEVMSVPRASSTGPDGIPFSVYRLLIDIAAPLLFRYLLSISLGRRTNRSFNYSNLFFFPKDSSN